MLIPFETIIKKYNMNINGILHIGAHNCEELDSYNNYGLKNNQIIWVEANPELVKNNLTIDKSRIIKNFICCDEDSGTKILNISNNGQSSSIFELGTHKNSYPSIKYTDLVEVKNNRIDTMYSKENIPTNFANFVNIDIQGAELLALKGMGDLLHYFEYAYVEVNRDYVYKDGALINEIDEYLSKYNFKRIETNWTNEKWGEALYIKNNLDLLKNVRYSEEIWNIDEIILASIKYTDFVEVKNNWIDTMYSKENIPKKFTNLLNMDIQRNELLALKGMGDLLHYFEYAYVEVNRDYVYTDCVLINEIDEYLLKYNFKKVETSWMNEDRAYTLYIKNKKNFDLLKNFRCSEEIWQLDGITLEEALEKAKSDPEVKALHWNNNNGGDGRIRGVKGCYQGAGGSIGTVVTNDWDTIVINNVDLLKNVRCSEEIWQIEGITLEEALEKAQSDPEVKALHWYNNSGGDGRIRGVKGWYQGAGGSIGTVVNNDWDTIVINNFDFEILSSFYYANNDNRHNEIVTTLKNNLGKSFISKINLFITNSDYIKFIKTELYIKNSNRINFIIKNSQPTYKELFIAASQFHDKIVCICNSDIELSITNMSVLNKLDDDTGFFISRHEHDNSKPLIENFVGSHDAFIFTSNSLKKNILDKSLNYINYIQNTLGIEALLTKFFIEELKYRIYNPCYEIKLTHHHKSNYRTYSDKHIGYSATYKNNNIEDLIWNKYIISPCTLLPNI